MKVLIGAVSNFEYSEPNYYLLGVFTDEDKMQKVIEKFETKNKETRTFIKIINTNENIELEEKL